MIEFILGIIVGILLSMIAFLSGNKKEEIIKKAKEIMRVKEHGYIAGLSEDEQNFQDSLKSDFKDIRIK